LFQQKLKSHRKPESFIRQPKYPGGYKAMDEFIKGNLKYPEEALKNRIEGTVSVTIDIDVNGKVTSSKIKHGIGYGCDEEALRLAELLRFEKKKYKGLYVMFHHTINIHFHLPGAPQLNYQYKESESKEKKINYKISL
jgi:TonB family protein